MADKIFSHTMINDMELRLRCLELANTGGDTTKDTLEVADLYYKYVTDTLPPTEPELDLTRG